MGKNSTESIDVIVNKQLKQYIIETKRHVGYDFVIAVRDLSYLELHAKTRGARVEPLEKTQGTCFVVSDSTCSDLWVRTYPTVYANYREAFKNFAAIYHKVSLSGGEEGYNVDHMLNGARANAYGMGFVRVALVKEDVNQGWGRTYERRVTGRHPVRHKNVYPGTLITFAKILGAPAPRSNTEAPQVSTNITDLLLEAGVIKQSEYDQTVAELITHFKIAYRHLDKSFGEMTDEKYFGPEYADKISSDETPEE